MKRHRRKEIKQEEKIKIFCCECHRVFGCKGRMTGGDRRECTDCLDIVYCVAGILIENTSTDIQKRATSGFCPTCYEKKRLQILDRRKTLTP